MSQTTPGSFVWYELLTSDPKKAIEFYGPVIGWKTEAFDANYTMFMGSQGPIGGTMKLPEQAAKMGSPPHWTSNVQVADVDATVAQVKKLGGQIYVEPNDIPKVGRFAVIADPQGASISVFKPADPMTVHDELQPGEMCWSELMTADHEAAFAFYSKIFGWAKSRDFDMGPMGKYLIYGHAGKDLGGMMDKPKDMDMPNHWQYYIQVADLAKTIESAKQHGGKLVMGPQEVPGGAHVAQFFDPQGAFFAIHEVARGK